MYLRIVRNYCTYSNIAISFRLSLTITTSADIISLYIHIYFDLADSKLIKYGYLV